MPVTFNPALARRHHQWAEQIERALQHSGLEQAARLALQALAEGIEDATILNLAASARFGEGRVEDAINLLERACSLAPQDPHVLNSLGTCLQASGRTTEALEAFEQASRLDPRLVAAHFNRGDLLESLNDFASARLAYEQAITIDPSEPASLASLAWLDAQAGRGQTARSLAERAIDADPNSLLAHMAIASVDLQVGALDAAAERLTALAGAGLQGVNRAIVLGLIGDLLDAQGEPGEAFAAYQASNDDLSALYAPQFDAPGIEGALAETDRLKKWFKTAEPGPWQEAPPAAPLAGHPKEHVFLVGFPRSGTTLLENVLASHPEVVSLEEKNCLEQVSASYFASDEGLAHLGSIGREEAERARADYWAAVRRFGAEPSGKVFIDKFPLSSVLLPAIAKLFPNARILFALRDSRDVVLSCFRRRFGMNRAMYQLLTIEGAAAFYGSVMELNAIYGRVLPLPRHVLRYEDLVGDFDQSLRDVCAYIGIEWDPAMLNFAANARRREIATPSAAQVARGLKRDGQGHWRRYQDQLAPVLPLLQPWVAKFGYEA